LLFRGKVKEIFLGLVGSPLASPELESHQRSQMEQISIPSENAGLIRLNATTEKASEQPNEEEGLNE
jgi:hypothetical protein